MREWAFEEYFAGAITCKETGQSLEYRDLMQRPHLKDTLERSLANELGRLAQGVVRDIKGTCTITFIKKSKIPTERRRDITYGRMVVSWRPEKDEPNRSRPTAGGNLINYPFEVSAPICGMPTIKLHWNSVLSTPGAEYATFDISNFYLNCRLKRPEYMRLPLKIFPREILDKYNLEKIAVDGWVYAQIDGGMYGLPQAGVLANKLLKERLRESGYHETTHTPGLFYHETRPIWFTLVVDDFGVKYVGKQHARHLMNVLSKFYEMEEDWLGKLYCGITLDWNYREGYVDISMPNYVAKQLVKYRHKAPKRRQNCPYEPEPRVCGKKAQEAPKKKTSPKVSAEEKKYIQQVVGSFLYYARAVDMTILHALNSIAAEQADPTERTMRRVKQLLDYMHTHQDAVICFYASDMVLNVHSDASYLTATRGRSRAGGYFFLGSIPTNNRPIKLNGNVAVTCAILKLVAASAAEAELGALFLNAQEARILRLTLAEMGHPQPPTPVHVDNSTCIGIVNNTIKRQRSRAMEMRYFWLLDQQVQKFFSFQYHPGQENLGDYPSKAHTGAVHQHVRPWYIHVNNSPRELPRALRPSSRRGCVETLGDPYNKRTPLPSVPIP